MQKIPLLLFGRKKKKSVNSPPLRWTPRFHVIRKTPSRTRALIRRMDKWNSCSEHVIPDGLDTDKRPCFQAACIGKPSSLSELHCRRCCHCRLSVSCLDSNRPCPCPKVWRHRLDAGAPSFVFLSRMIQPTALRSHVRIILSAVVVIEEDLAHP